MPLPVTIQCLVGSGQLYPPIITCQMYQTVFEKMNLRNLTWGQMGKVQPLKKDIYSDLSVYTSLQS